jgi:lipopolysaccharide transport system ATP-binding protein
LSKIIEVRGLSKSYIINHEGKESYTALRDVISQKAKKIFSFPNWKSTVKTQEEFWALKDIDFDIEQGDRLGIIGRNGAGKSTLLKILSRITEPTSGSIKIKGRIASLLEVGTGFHPELSGRENIFLNGAILGMSRAEIKKHFDAIVDFAEVERFLDTPVKRYSSGMYVRLAFAVAAHLEPEILIVDEVLAVGDAQFQKKCLGKMEDVSKNEGRTVLFVSHNMGALKSICSRLLFLKNGNLIIQGDVEPIIIEYLSENKKINELNKIPRDFNRKFNTGKIFIDSIKVLNKLNEPQQHFSFGEEIKLKIDFEVLDNIEDVLLQIIISSNLGENAITVNDCKDGVYLFKQFQIGLHSVEIILKNKFLPIGFNISAFFSTQNGTPLEWVEYVSNFNVTKEGIKTGSDYPWGPIYGYVELNPKWEYLKS